MHTSFTPTRDKEGEALPGEFDGVCPIIDREAHAFVPGDCTIYIFGKDGGQRGRYGLSGTAEQYIRDCKLEPEEITDLKTKILAHWTTHGTEPGKPFPFFDAMDYNNVGSRFILMTKTLKAVSA